MVKIRVRLKTVNYYDMDDYVELECPGIPRVGDWFSLPKEAARKLIRKALRSYWAFKHYVDWVYGTDQFGYELILEDANIVSQIDWWPESDTEMVCYVAIDTSVKKGERREDVKYQTFTEEQYRQIKKDTYKAYHLSDDNEE